MQKTIFAGDVMPVKQRLDFKDEPLFLMDGSAYIFRSFYANQNMTRSDGMPTNVLYMVLRMLLKILREESPRHFVFVLDGKGKNFRHRLYTDYKANRIATPEPLSMQIPPLIEVIKSLGIPVTVSDDCEADDCIASLSRRFAAELPVVIIGADKDLKQCLAPNIAMWDPSSKEERITTLASFAAEQGFSPEYWPDYQAIVGDSSDNIPGVPGIGPKGASTLMREFKGLEDIFGRLAAVPPNLRKKLEGHQEQALVSRQLTRLKTDTCTELRLGDLELFAPKQDELLKFLNEYELRSLFREVSSMLRINGMASGFGQNSQSGATTITNGFEDNTFQTSFKVKKPSETQKNAKTVESCGNLPGSCGKTDSEKSTHPTTQTQGTLWGSEQGSLLDGLASTSTVQPDAPQLKEVSLLAESQVYILVPLKEINGGKNEQRLLIGDGKQEYICSLNTPEGPHLVPGLLKVLSGKELVLPGFKQACELYPALRELALEKVFDVSLAAWLLSPEEYDYSFGKLLHRWGPDAQTYIEQNELPSGSGGLALALATLMKERLAAQKLDEVLRNLEMPLIPVLLGMQDAGLCIDMAAFEAFCQETQGLLDELTKNIYTAAGKNFNIRSSQQLGKILYEELKLGKARKTAGGQASTAQAALEKLEGTHEIIDLILEYRKLEKLRSTYLEPLPKLADKNCRLHTSFNQSSTATGRLSSSNPNLQNIPVRGPLGGRMRACFTSAPGNLLVSADYSQIELRVVAHLSEDPTLLDAFQKGEDIHRRTAALIFEVAQDQITPDQRRGAKTINFGLVYGMGPQKLARELGISMNEAKTFIDRYFERLGKLRQYFDSIEENAKEHGYVCTMTGRRRYIPEIHSANQQLRSQARRQAINTCIQGSAADIIKLAMLAAYNDDELHGLNARLILQIHDELLLECPEANAEAAGARLAALMSAVKPGGITLNVPLLSEYGSGRSWADAH